jgi:hypothetical protein
VSGPSRYQQFDDIASHQVGWYVYALRDPRDGAIFYVGKGKQNRWFDHIKAAEAASAIEELSLKLSRIREIHASGQMVEAFLIRHGIATEKAAYDVEAAVIHSYRLLEKAPGAVGIELTNIAEVHHPERGLTDVRVAQTLFNAPPAPAIDFPCAFFRLPKLWYPTMSDEALREATSGWWSRREVARGKERARYAFAVSRQIIRGAYAIEPAMWRTRRKPDRDWENDVGKEPRWGFPNCKAAPEMSHFLNTSVKHLYKRGDASAARFLNCR